MAVMNYETQNITKIKFEDSLFVTTELDKDTNKEVKEYIESRGGIVKSSVTKGTNYLIYRDGEEETAKYKKALELVQEKGLEINILPFQSFETLIAMTYRIPGITKLSIEGKQYVITGFDPSENKEIQEYIASRGGIIKYSVTKSTNYLIYKGGEWETEEYLSALNLAQEKKSEITILPLNSFTTLCKGKGIVEFGSYPFEADGAKHPIKWAVLKREGNKALLLSVYGLEAKPYNEKLEEVTWETCTLRKWLNENFYQDAFSDEEKKRIQLTSNKNADNPSYHRPGGNDTEDKVFLLSIDEVKEYLAEALERRTAPTPYAIKQGADTRYNSNCWWWLRSPGGGANDAAGVDRDGNIHDLGNLVFFDRNAVCPALWVNLESEIE